MTGIHTSSGDGNGKNGRINTTGDGGGDSTGDWMVGSSALRRFLYRNKNTYT